VQINYIIPGAISAGPLGAGELRRRERLLQSWAFPGTQVSVTDIDNGVMSIESLYEEALVVPSMIEHAEALEKQGVDAVIVGCFGDPGLAAAREILSIPVIGPGESCMLLAAQLGHRIGVLLPVAELEASIREQAFRAGVLQKLAAVRNINESVLGQMSDPEKSYGNLLKAARVALEEDNVDVLIFGCMTTSFMNFAPRMRAELGVPVLNAGLVALKMAESLVSADLSHSKRAFPVPRKRRA
jgi:allantoin racemase